MRPLPGAPPALVITNGKGRLFVRTLLPADARVRLVSGDDLYSVGGRSYPPSRDTGPAPQCRVEMSPTAPAAFDAFLHVLTATGAEVGEVPPARATRGPDAVTVEAAGARIRFDLDRVAGTIEIGGSRTPLASTVVRGD